MADSPRQEQMHLDRGRVVILNAFVWRQEDGSWHVRLVHRHEGELAMCPGHVAYSNLTTLELADVLQGHVDWLDGRFSLVAGECHPLMN